MLRLRQVIKESLKHVIHALPWGRDLYLVLAKNRLSISYRGVYKSYTEANQALIGRDATHYDLVNAKKSVNKEHENAKLDTYFKDTDYPLFFWLSQVIQEEVHILELGGSIGHFYYAAKRMMKLPNKLRWTIAELPEAVALGEEIATERGATNVAFINSVDLTVADPAQVFLTAGTLQYIEKPVWEMLDTLVEPPQHLLLHHMPIHETREFWTLQNLKVCEVPYRIYSRQQLIEELKGRGYELVKEWLYPRYIEIPFRRSLDIKGYCGFYFTKAGNNA